jgi:chemotaxis response regulator CheB
MVNNEFVIVIIGGGTGGGVSLRAIPSKIKVGLNRPKNNQSNNFEIST